MIVLEGHTEKKLEMALELFATNCHDRMDMDHFKAIGSKACDWVPDSEV